MKVFCIDVYNPKRPDLQKPEHFITEGEVYTVSDTHFDDSDGHEYCYLEERDMYPRPSYKACRFIPVQDQDDIISFVVTDEILDKNKIIQPLILD